MDQQYDYPPPPPSTQGAAGHEAVPGDFYQQHRRRGAPSGSPTVSTSFLRTHAAAAQSQSPIAAASPSTHGRQTGLSYSPSTPSALNPSPRTPQIAMQPYNPGQWSGRGAVSGTQMVFSRASNLPQGTREATGMEASMPSPPPPYSPDTPDHNHSIAAISSPVLDAGGFVTSPLATDGTARVSPRTSNSPAFPPPPSAQSSRHRDRSSSGLTGQRSIFSLSSLRGKQPANAEPQHSNSIPSPQVLEVRPPAARRAASTGHIQPNAAAATFTAGPADRSSPESHWQPGMPLPGPPPGPPPPGARSQSLNRYPNDSISSGQPPDYGRTPTAQLRRAAAAPSTLGPVPPTPADWVDDSSGPSNTVIRQLNDQAEANSFYQPLRINTGANRDASLTRRPAKRDTSAQGLRERRSLSRRAPRANDLPGDESGPSKLVLAPDTGSISKRREHTRNASSYTDLAHTPLENSRPLSGRPMSSSKAPANVMTPPYTPAVHDGSKQSGRVPGSASSDRPMSQMLHTPSEESISHVPLSPGRPPSAGSTKTSTRLDAFGLQALERHRSFIEKEITASSDEERLELFANFMVHESRLRRDRYLQAYNAMAGDIVDLTRDMWRSYSKGGRRVATPSTSVSSLDPTIPSWASDGAHGHEPGSASSFGDFTPGTDTGSAGDFPAGLERSESRQWGEVFKPSLSPIPSMAVSTVPDESSSRGRQPSRWWEQSQDGSGSIGRPDRMERNPRETKYMGVNIATLQDNSDPSLEMLRSTPTPGTSSKSFGYGPNEYPPEKVGWHESPDFDTPMATPARHEHRPTSTPGLDLLDVSRLVTLPPPYPRHHPALNNSHPLLAELRSEHRSLADHSDIQKIKDAYLDADFANQRRQQEQDKERKTKLRSTISEKIADGTMSFADAAKVEAEFEAEEPDRARANARSNFDVFESTVAHPLNALLTERLGKATASIEKLQAELVSRTQVSNPNQAQEEGDEHPERLEQLTLLKWLFEAREQLHKEMFDLHAQRSEKYSEVVLTPYRISKLQNKIDEATAFFAKDSIDRQMTFAKDSLKRFEQLQSSIEDNVSRGVEDQLSAFWDIAPNLLEVIQQVPESPIDFEVRIPPTEYEENPSYSSHPLQYLYSLLNHAEKSAYQFIESQTNMLCLLHEVRTARTKCSLRVIEIERLVASPAGNDDEAELKAEMQEAMNLEEHRLTEDLKDKVGEVERQWREALGDGIEECKQKVKEWLEESGGWEDGLE
ncbi:Hypothetical protein R9X50_00307100 [Acrodontium crateriforme]|uniref:Uncharacterized protein n=1 Tax=Acrodontium crateriforme TaxID=150365 RepID=A0AAQ3M528_9PEZI|nr:Hypothetical protein R9X50_00307100 [Acrodontium crateriforme]